MPEVLKQIIVLPPDDLEPLSARFTKSFGEFIKGVYFVEAEGLAPVELALVELAEDPALDVELGVELGELPKEYLLTSLVQENPLPRSPACGWKTRDDRFAPKARQSRFEMVITWKNATFCSTGI